MLKRPEPTLYGRQSAPPYPYSGGRSLVVWLTKCSLGSLNRVLRVKAQAIVRSRPVRLKSSELSNAVNFEQLLQEQAGSSLANTSHIELASLYKPQDE